MAAMYFAAVLSFSFFVYALAGNIIGCPCCVCEQQQSEIRLVCTCLPQIIPTNTTCFVLHEKGGPHGLLKFIHPSWQNVKSLDLHFHRNRREKSLYNDTFYGVPELEELHLSNLRKLETIPQGTFKKLQKLKVLDVSNNHRLWFDGLLTTFSDLKNNRLELINVSRTNHYDKGLSVVSINSFYMRELSNLKMKALDMSWTGKIDIYLDGRSIFFVTFPYLEVFNASRSFVIIPPNMFSKGIHTDNRYDLLFPALKHFVYWGMDIFVPEVTKSPDCVLNNANFPYLEYCANYSGDSEFFLPPLLETFNLDHSTTWDGYCVEQATEYATCFKGNHKLKTFSFKHSGITGWNMVLVDVNGLDTLDLRHNRIGVITDSSVRYIPKLKRLLLGSNQLWMYQRNMSFEGVLNKLTKLQEIDLSDNKLSTIPYLLFGKNKRLEKINLSDNKLGTLSFKLSHLSNLKILDLSANIITVLSDFRLNDIRALAVELDKPFINMADNKFNCSCLTKDFVKRIQVISKSLIAYNSYRCSYKDSIVNIQSLDEAVLNRDCILEIVVVALPVFCAVVAIIIFTALLYRNRIYLIKIYVICRFWRYRKRLINVEDRVFLAYSHHDKDLVFSHIYSAFNSKLQKLLGTEEDVLYINDKDFALPGLIDEEIVRAVSSCKCMVALISRRFLKSSWTHLEVSYSWTKKRPIILVFLEDIREKELHGILGFLYNKNVRLMWPGIEDKEKENVFWACLLRGLVKLLDSGKTQNSSPADDTSDDIAEYNTDESCRLLLAEI